MLIMVLQQKINEHNVKYTIKHKNLGYNKAGIKINKNVHPNL